MVREHRTYDAADIGAGERLLTSVVRQRVRDVAPDLHGHVRYMYHSLSRATREADAL